MILDDLYETILERKNNPSGDSYVSSLFEKGRNEMMRKVGEEAVEVIIAAGSRDRKEIIHEIADLWFHSMVLMANEGISHKDILDELESRKGRRKR